MRNVRVRNKPEELTRDRSKLLRILKNEILKIEYVIHSPQIIYFIERPT